MSAQFTPEMIVFILSAGMVLLVVLSAGIIATLEGDK